jgi:hypothetical protein
MMTTDRDFRVVAEAATIDPDEELLASLRLDPTQAEAVVKVPVTLQARKPLKHEFVRVRRELALDVSAIEIKDGESDDAGLYLVKPHLQGALQAETVSFVLRPYVTRTAVLRLWPIRLPSSDGKQNEWHRSAGIAAARAMEKWVRVTANKALGAYELFEAANQPPEPDWPPLSLADMMRLAFVDRGRVIDSIEHPVVRLLLGKL